MAALCRICLVAVLSLSRLKQAPSDVATMPAATGAGLVSIIAFDSYGHFLGVPNIITFKTQDGVDLASTFHSGTAEHVPFGEYRLKSQLVGFFPEERKVNVFQPEVTIVTGLVLGNEVPLNPPSLRGKIVASKHALPEHAFVKITGLFTTFVIESAISPSGTFEATGVPSGKYLFLVVSEKGVLGSRVIDLPHRGKVLLYLS